MPSIYARQMVLISHNTFEKSTKISSELPRHGWPEEWIPKTSNTQIPHLPHQRNTQKRKEMLFALIGTLNVVLSFAIHNGYALQLCLPHRLNTLLLAQPP